LIYGVIECFTLQIALNDDHYVYKQSTQLLAVSFFQRMDAQMIIPFKQFISSFFFKY